MTDANSPNCEREDQTLSDEESEGNLSSDSRTSQSGITSSNQSAYARYRAVELDVQNGKWILILVGMLMVGLNLVDIYNTYLDEPYLLADPLYNPADVARYLYLTRLRDGSSCFAGVVMFVLGLNVPRYPRSAMSFGLLVYAAINAFILPLDTEITLSFIVYRSLVVVGLLLGIRGTILTRSRPTA